MRTSNKILLGIFLAIIILTTSIHLYVYAKYKRGEFVPFQRESPVFMDRVDVPETRFVSITGLGSAEIINSDTAYFVTSKDKLRRISHRMVKDTLMLIGDATLTEEQLARGARNYQTLKLYLPSSVQVRTAYSGLMIRGNADSTKAPSFNIHMLTDCWLNMPGNENNPAYINRIVITGRQSTFDLEDNVVVNDLDLKLRNTKVNTKQSKIRKLTLDIDDRSAINLSGNSINALQ